MTAFRTCLIAFFVVLAAYSAYVTVQHGANLVPVFLNDLFSLTWPGQFNLDFAMYLALSGLWVAWRGGFDAGAIEMARRISGP